MAGIDAGRRPHGGRGPGDPGSGDGGAPSGRQRGAGPPARRARRMAVRLPGPNLRPRTTSSPSRKRGWRPPRSRCGWACPTSPPGALDAANAAWASQGLYGRVLPLWERRSSIQPLVTDVAEARRLLRDGCVDLVRARPLRRGAGAGRRGHRATSPARSRAWSSTPAAGGSPSLQRLGRWDEALDEYELVVALLGEGADHPPYFVTQGIAVATLIRELRGDRADERPHDLDDVVARDRTGRPPLPVPAAGPGRCVAIWSGRDRSRSRRRGGSTRTTRTRPRPSSSPRAEHGTRRPTSCEEMREHAERAGTAALVPFADRLEGRASLASGDATTAAGLLHRAADRFEELSAPWECALTLVDLARALAALGKRDDARAALDDAISTFTALRSVRDLERARDVL